MAKIFLSYLKADLQIVSRIRATLEHNCHEVWQETSVVPVGRMLSSPINTGLFWCDCFVLLLSRNAERSGWLGLGLSHLALREFTARPDRVILVRLDDCDSRALPFWPAAHAIDLSASFEAGVSALLGCLATEITEEANICESDAKRLEFCIALAVHANNSAMWFYNHSLGENFSLEAGKNAITKADHIAQANAIQSIRNVPDYALEPVIGEEPPHRGNRVAEQGYTWVLDALDGTYNFENRVPLFCSAVGVLKNGKPFIGAVFDPSANEVYFAIEGRPTRVWQVAQGEVHLSRCQALPLDPRQSLLGIHLSSRPEIVEKMLGNSLLLEVCQAFRGVRALGSTQLALAYVATGRLQAFWQLGAYLWDQVAGVVLVQNAGGLVRDCGFKVQDWHPKTRDFVACSNPSLLRELVRILKRCPHV